MQILHQTYLNPSWILRGACAAGLTLMFLVDIAWAQEPKKAAPPGSPAAILADLEQLLQIDPEDKTPEGVKAALRVALKKIRDAADKLLAHPAATEEQKTEAYRYKISAFYQGAQVEEPGAAQALEAFAKELKEKMPKSNLAALATYLGIKARHDGPTGLSSDAIPSIQEFIKSFPNDDGGIALLQEVGMSAELTEDLDKAKQAYQLIKTHFADHPVAEQITGVLRRLDLVGKPMQVSGETLEGHPFDLKNLKGKVVLVDFWATWCGPCLAEMPHVREVYKKYKDKGFEIVGVPLDEDRDALVEFLKDAEMPWMHLYSKDPNKRGFESPAAAYYGISAIPAMMLIGRDGNVAHLGVRGGRLEELVSALLAKPAAKVSAVPQPATK